MKRGEIWWASLSIPEGSEPGYRRPVVIVQADSFNRSRIQTVVVAAITSSIPLADAPGNVLLTRREGRLSKESVVNVSQLLTLDRSFLTERVGRVSAASMGAIDEGLRLVLSL
jgi:mRNA interferase MazF